MSGNCYFLIKNCIIFYNFSEKFYSLSDSTESTELTEKTESSSESSDS